MESRFNKLGLIGKADFLMLNVSVANLYAMTQAMISNNITEAIVINQNVLLKQSEERNIWGYCSTLLSLSLCYYRENRLDEATMALNDCIAQSKCAGIISCFNAANKNLYIINRSEARFKDYESPIVDEKTGWCLEADPFCVFLRL